MELFEVKLGPVKSVLLELDFLQSGCPTNKRCYDGIKH